MAEVRIGTSGWRYKPWRGTFYPKGLPQHAELAYVASKLTALEINGSFYSLQRPESYARWYEQTPEHFIFAVKGPRFITHMRRLRETRQPLANFFASGVFNLREKLGPILWQLPPGLKYEPERIESFLCELPRDTEHALALARHREAWMKGRTRLAIDANRPLRYAMEVRHESFVCPEFLEQLRTHNVTLVVADTAGKWPLMLDVTADFVYVRLHGDTELYRSGYSDAVLDMWAQRIRDWSLRGYDVYCFFDNTDNELRAPYDAQTLMRKVASAHGRTTERTRRKTTSAESARL